MVLTGKGRALNRYELQDSPLLGYSCTFGVLNYFHKCGAAMQEPTCLQRLVRFGEYKLDTRAGGLHKGDSPLQLHKQPLQVLLVLLEHQGELVT